MAESHISHRGAATPLCLRCRACSLPGQLYRYSKGGAFEQFSLRRLCIADVLGDPASYRRLRKTKAGPTNADAYWLALVALVSYVGNVILPIFAMTQFGAMALHMGGVMTEIYPGSVWIRKAIAGFGALMISGLLRFAEHMVTTRTESAW